MYQNLQIVVIDLKGPVCTTRKRTVLHAVGSKTIPRSPVFPPVLTSYKLLEIERPVFPIAAALVVCTTLLQSPPPWQGVSARGGNLLLGYARGAKGAEQETQMQEAAWRAASVARTCTECAERPSWPITVLRPWPCNTVATVAPTAPGRSTPILSQVIAALLAAPWPWLRCGARHARLLMPPAHQGTSGVRFCSHRGPRV
jgi:hypothetical protein